MLTATQSRTLGKGYAAILERERERREPAEYTENSVLTIRFRVVGNPNYYDSLVRQALRNYRGIVSIETITPDDEPPAPERRFLTVEEAHRATGYSIHQITRWLRAGDWIGSKVDGHWQIDLDSPMNRPPRKRRY